MKIYLIKNVTNQSYESFYSAVVCAESEEKARMIHPRQFYENAYQNWDGIHRSDDWAFARDIEVEYLGEASSENSKPRVICVDFQES